MGGGPDEVAIAGSHVYVVDRTGNKLLVVSAGAVKSSIKVGKHPYDVAVDPRTATIYVTNHGSNTVSVIKIKK